MLTYYFYKNIRYTYDDAKNYYLYDISKTYADPYL